MTDRFPPQLEIPLDLACALFEAGVRSAHASVAAARRTRPSRGLTLKPGADTPLWNALAESVTAQFKKRGDRAQLARILGLPRQRLTEMLRSRLLQPDAERTLLLLVWLHAKRHGKELV